MRVAGNRQPSDRIGGGRCQLPANHRLGKKSPPIEFPGFFLRPPLLLPLFSIPMPASPARRVMADRRGADCCTEGRLHK